MSFGFSPSDIVTLVKLTTKTYQGWKNACGEYADITSSLNGLCILLKRIRDETNRPTSVLARSEEDKQELRIVLRGCRKTVQELDDVFVKFRSLSSSRQRNWDRLRLGVKNLGELRTKLIQHTSTLTAYLEAVGLGSLTRVEDRLSAMPGELKRHCDALAAEMRAGRREGSVMTTYEDDEKEIWRTFRRELVTADGIKSSTIHKYKPLLREYIRKLAEEGKLDEEEPDQADDSDLASDHSPQQDTEARHASHFRPDISHTEQRYYDKIPNWRQSLPATNADLPQGLQDRMYKDYHSGLNWNWDGPFQVHYKDNPTTTQSMTQPGPQGFVLQWTLPLRPAIAEHHALMVRHCSKRLEYRRRLIFTHVEQGFAEILPFILRQRGEGARGAFLSRRVPWLPPREPDDRMNLRIVLPPLWSYKIKPNDRLRFVYHGHCRDSEKKGWVIVKYEDGVREWCHIASGHLKTCPPAEAASLEPGLHNRYDRIWEHVDGDGDDELKTAARQLVELGDLEEFRAIQKRQKNRKNKRPRSNIGGHGASMALWGLFPELSREGVHLRDMERQTMMLEWTPELEQANPGKREHLIEWQARMDNIASRYLETRHLVSWHDRASCDECSRSKYRPGEYFSNLLGFAESHLHPGQGLDHYGICFPPTRHTPETERSYQIGVGEHLWNLDVFEETCRTLHLSTHMEGWNRVSQTRFHEFAFDVIKQLVNLLYWDTGEHPAECASCLTRAAFACFFARKYDTPILRCSAEPPYTKYVLGPQDVPSVWEALATFLRTIYGCVRYQPNEFVLWRANEYDGEVKCRVYGLQRYLIRRDKNGRNPKTRWLGHIWCEA